MRTLAALLALPLVWPATGFAQTARVSVATGGAQANGPSFLPSISGDGRFVAFTSLATNLVPGDTNAARDAFVHDRVTGVTTRVSVGVGDSQGTPGAAPSVPPYAHFKTALSADGRFVAFSSNHANLVPGDTNGSADVFIRDRTTGTTTRVSVATGGGQVGPDSLGFGSGAPSVSADGRFVAFDSFANSLVPADTNNRWDVFVHDRQTGATERVSVATGGVPLSNDRSNSGASISGDGRYVTFTSTRIEERPDGSYGFPDVYLHDRQTVTTTRLSSGASDQSARDAVISDDGRFIAYFNTTTAEGFARLYLHDRTTGQSAPVANVFPESTDLDVTADGGLIAFVQQLAPDLPWDVYVHNRQTGQSLKVSVASSGASGSGGVAPGAFAPAISADGRLVAFQSEYTNLVAGDTNAQGDIFVRDRAAAPGDADGDGLPDIWEDQFGLNPSSAAAGDGPGGDPDLDGRSNQQEFDAGTHPRGFVTRYLAEGAVNTFFDTQLALFNPGTTAVRVLLRYQKEDRTTVAQPITVPAASRRTIDPETLAGMSATSFSTVIEADGLVVVDRTMTWGGAGYGSHAETAFVAPSPTWYLAEGATTGQFHLFYLLQNPNPGAVTATVRYLLPGGAAPVERTYNLPGTSRTTIYVNQQGGILAATDVSAVITATQPILVERAMYVDRPGQPFAAGHESGGVTAPALNWFLAEGATGSFFDLFVLIANPNSAPAQISAEYLQLGGGVLAKTYTVPANGRFTIYVDAEEFPAGSGQRLLESAALSTTIRATNGVPVIVERAMWWPGPQLTSAFWSEAHNSPGATTTGVRWALAEGEIGGPRALETYVLMANTSTHAGQARVTLFFEDGATAQRTYALAAKSRTNVAVGSDFPEAAGRRFGTVVESLGTTPAELVVERAMYSTVDGAVWAAGTNALGTRLSP